MQSKSWHKRKWSKVISRLAFVAPSEGERYYLRLLIVGVSGLHSFAEFLTIDSRGLAEPDDLVKKILDEAVDVQLPDALQRLFATILIFLEPSNPTWI